MRLYTLFRLQNPIYFYPLMFFIHKKWSLALLLCFTGFMGRSQPELTNTLDSLSKLERTTEADSSRVKLLQLIGKELLRNYELDKADSVYRMTAHISDSIGRVDLWALSHANIGITYYLKDDKITALRYLLEAIEKMNYASYPDRCLNIQSMIANCYIDMRDFEKGRSILQSIVEKAREDDLPEQEARALGGIGLIFNRQQSYRKAVSFLLPAATIYARLKHPSAATTTSNLGGCYSQLNMLDSSLYYLRVSDSIIHAIGGNRYLEAANSAIRATIFHHQERFSESVREARKAHASGAGYNLLQMQSTARNLAITYSRLLEFDSSAFWLDSTISIQKLMFEQTKAEEISALEVEFHTKEKEQQIAVQALEIEAQQAQINTRNWILGGLACTLLLLLSLGLLERKRRREKNERIMLAEKWKAVESLRSKISQELHDSLGYKMRLMAEQVHSMHEQNAETQQLASDLRLAKEQVRSLAYRLFPQELENVSLDRAIQLHLTKMREVSAIDFRLSIYPEDALEDLGKERSSALYRILQECTSNVLEHSQATSVEIQISADDQQLTFTFEDNGAGFDPALASQGSGLVNMQQRCADLEAEFHLDTKPGRGTIINIHIPLFVHA